MKTYASLRDAEYTVQMSQQGGPFPCCGSCVHLETGGNALSCNRVEGHPRVVPQGICKLFKDAADTTQEEYDASETEALRDAEQPADIPSD